MCLHIKTYDPSPNKISQQQTKKIQTTKLKKKSMKVLQESALFVHIHIGAHTRTLILHKQNTIRVIEKRYPHTNALRFAHCLVM